ncbi:MAG TPA: SRPBCC family protein, partial [Pyrinomonadaceae bacterium]|nr:SRPBCC family protein [Pyrinomonadaceae bacterium]
GSVFRWKSGPGTITSTLEEVEPPREIGWSGRSMGIIAVHVHRLEPSPEGTKVYAEESFDGLMVRVFKGASRKTLQKGINGGLASLKKEAERRGGDTS